MDNVADFNRVKPFTVINMAQTIWAKVGPEEITVRVVGEESPIMVKKEDDLFNFYLNQFKNHKAEMLKQSFK